MCEMYVWISQTHQTAELWSIVRPHYIRNYITSKHGFNTSDYSMSDPEVKPILGNVSLVYQQDIIQDR